MGLSQSDITHMFLAAVHRRLLTRRISTVAAQRPAATAPTAWDWMALPAKWHDTEGCCLGGRSLRGKAKKVGSKVRWLRLEHGSNGLGLDGISSKVE